jgi:polyisoprenoid-binding protein YceI
MLNRILLFSFFLLITANVKAQGRFFTKSGTIDFYSKAPLEDIEAKNKTVTAVLDTRTGVMQFSVLMKGFEFEQALMQEHFNENFVESDKFPKTEFKGIILNNPDIDYSKPGSHKVKVKGTLSLHGVTKPIEAEGNLKVNDDNIKAESTFHILLSDYGVKRPAIVKDKISNTIRIIVDAKLEPL